MTGRIFCMKDNPIKDQSYAFALEIVKYCKLLQKEQEYDLSRQLLNSGTSIGANIEEANQGQSKADFIAKMSISLKEAHETDYWLRLIHDGGCDIENRSIALRTQLDGVISLLTAIIKSSKANL